MLLSSYLFIAVREFLRNESREQLIGLGGTTLWSARSAHFNPLDFCIWDIQILLFVQLKKAVTSSNYSKDYNMDLN